ncbi:hypothetical protein ALC62_06300 [Cyphomyrmex costatus]|uniref:Circadian clock-controlled protein n=1 Tax=Cyphomyrmex costatus TaxID=456900 RepID=A0A151IJJ5_9HYME|nr:hypothetical protein ALC62_06300 [Cyphomyrmex costatus]
MFVVIFTLAFITVHIGAEIPSYIHVCGRRDPNLEQCIINNVENLKGKICDGIPELGIPSGNPYTFDKLLITDGPNTKIYIRDAKVMGACDFDIKFLHADIDRLHFDVEIVFKRIEINTTYDFNIRLLVPIAYKGLIHLIITSFINVCGRKNPNLNKCILDNIDNIKDKICEGIPELDVLPNNPLVIEKLIISDTPNSKISLQNVKVTGICDFVVKYLHSDLEKLHFDVELLFRRLQLNATYDFDIRLLVPIVNKGPVYITTNNVEAKVNLDMKVVTKNGKRYVYLAKMKINLDVKGYTAEYGLNNAEQNRLNEVISNFIGNNQEEVIAVFKPALEETIVKRILLLSNNIVKHFTLEELFPDRE